MRSLGLSFFLLCALMCGGVAAFCQKDQAPASLAQAASVKQTEDQQARPQRQSPATASAPGGDQTGDRASSGSASNAAALPDLTPDAKGALSQEQMQRLFRVVAAKDLENDKLLRNYTYIEREVQNKLDGKEQSKSTEVKTYEIRSLRLRTVEIILARPSRLMGSIFSVQ